MTDPDPVTPKFRQSRPYARPHRNNVILAASVAGGED